MLKQARILLAAFALVGISAPALAAPQPITYEFNLASAQGTLVGSFTTDGQLGWLHAGNITAWSFEITISGNTRTISNLGTPGAPVVQLNEQFGSPLFATATDLTVGDGIHSGSFQFVNLGSQAGYFFTINPVVNSQLNFVNLVWSINDSAFSNRAFNSSTQVGSVIATVHTDATNAIPEPATLLLAGGALLGCWVGGRRKHASLQAA